MSNENFNFKSFIFSNFGYKDLCSRRGEDGEKSAIRIYLISSQALKQHLECYLSRSAASFRSHKLIYFVFSKIEIEIYFQRPADWSFTKFMSELRDLSPSI